MKEDIKYILNYLKHYQILKIEIEEGLNCLNDPFIKINTNNLLIDYCIIIIPPKENYPERTLYKQLSTYFYKTLPAYYTIP